jgi:molybdate transport system substrate-binding protein
MKIRLLFALLMVMSLTIPLAPSRANDSTTLTVFAAASLSDAFEEIADDFGEDHPGVEVVFNFGSSSLLATQLIEGAPADVFASANEKQMRVAREGGRIAGPVRIFAQNRLVLAVPADNPAHIRTMIDLARPGILLLVAASGVPVRDYTDTMLEQMAAVSWYGEDYREAVLANIVSEEDNVRQVAAKIALGEADAGIVYQSDITPDLVQEVRVIPIPRRYNPLATYPMAITNDTPHPELAQDFVDFVLSNAGQETLTKWGFIPMPNETAQ